jgi:RNase P protein component
MIMLKRGITVSQIITLQRKRRFYVIFRTSQEPENPHVLRVRSGFRSLTMHEICRKINTYLFQGCRLRGAILQVTK